MFKPLRLRLAIPPVTSPTSAGLSTGQVHITSVTLYAWPMVLGERARLLLLLVPCVATCATWLVVTFDASEAEPVNVLPMAEDHLSLRDLLGSAAVYIRLGLGDRWVHQPQNILRRRGCLRIAERHSAGLLPMT